MKKTRLALACATLAISGSLASMPAMATENGVTVYGSLNVGVESVNPDNFERYEGFRDAYSKVGVKGHYNLDASNSLFAKLEVAYDSANWKFRGPWNQDSNDQVKVAIIGASGNWGTATLGQQWMPYYNNIAYPVDMFSSYYSGFQTLTSFRIRDTLSYVSPSMGGLTLSASYSSPYASKRSAGYDERRIQAVASYTAGNTTVAAGIDDGGNYYDRIYGVAISHTIGNVYLAAKYETSDFDESRGLDDDKAINLFGSYTMGKNTFKLMLANMDYYGDDVVHVGYDYQYSKNLKFFAEYYNEESPAAISTVARVGEDAVDWPNNGGGDAITIGFHYGF